jgi:hypothetical protein
MQWHMGAFRELLDELLTHNGRRKVRWDYEPADDSWTCETVLREGMRPDATWGRSGEEALRNMVDVAKR